MAGYPVTICYRIRKPYFFGVTICDRISKQKKYERNTLCQQSYVKLYIILLKKQELLNLCTILIKYVGILEEHNSLLNIESSLLRSLSENKDCKPASL